MLEVPLTPCLVLMAGLPGTGKSTVARALAAELGGIVLDKDQVRAALFSEPWIEYSRQQDDFCIEILLQTAAYLLAASHVPPFLFLDGRVFAFRDQVERVVAWATGAGCRLKILHTICSDKTALQRLQTGHHLASNRNDDLYRKLKERFERIEYPQLMLDTEESLESSLTRCRSYLQTEEKF